MIPIEYRMEEQVAVVTMGQGENRFTTAFLEIFEALLEEIETRTSATALLVTSAHEKIWANGLDLEWLRAETARDPGAAADLSARLGRFLFRLLTYPLTTIAAINGHAFAGGAIMACAFDFRFMRSDRGYFCFPGVDLGIALLPSMEAVLKKALPVPLVWEAQITGRRYTAGELDRRGGVVKACSGETLQAEALAFARTQNKGRDILKVMKEVSFKNIRLLMENDDPAYLDALRGSLSR